MKDEEMAEQYAQNLEKELMKEYEEHSEYGQTAYLATIPTLHAKQAFLAGLKAGRPQWHDLRKDPNDLPKVKKGTSCTPVIILDSNNFFSVAHYCKGTIAGAFMIDGRQWETIAWCEIPTFDKE